MCEWGVNVQGPCRTVQDHPTDRSRVLWPSTLKIDRAPWGFLKFDREPEQGDMDLSNNKDSRYTTRVINPSLVTMTVAYSDMGQGHF